LLLNTNELTQSDVVYLVLGKETDLTLEIPKEIQPLLNEFSDLTLDELPSGLPPMKTSYLTNIFRNRPALYCLSKHNVTQECQT